MHHRGDEGGRHVDLSTITGEVQLHRQLPCYDDHRVPDQWVTHSGIVGVTPVAHLCPCHDRLIDLPVRFTWPMTATEDVQPEDVHRLA